MIASDTAHLALRNLREAVLRTVLTALGVAIGIASLVGMVSFGVAIEDQVVGAFMRSGLFDSVTVAPPISGFGRGGRGNAGPFAPRRRTVTRQAAANVKLDDDALRAFEKIDKVREVYPEVRVPMEVVFGDASEMAAARGVPMSSRGETVFRDMKIGRFFSGTSNDECLISLDFAHRMSDADPKTFVGKDLTLRFVSAADLRQVNPMAVVMGGGLNIQRTEQKCRVVGIVEREAGPNIAIGFAPVMIPLARARQMGSIDVSNLQNMLSQVNEKRTYMMATVKVNRPQDTEEVENKIKDMGYSAFSIADALQSEKKAFILLDLFLGLVGSIALTVASLGIVNTMVMSILERTREIGVMKAIGASDRDVRRIFLIEASLIGLLGGVSGIALGWTVGRAINAGANYYLRNQGVPATNLFLIPWWLIGGAIAFAVFVSLIAGSFPAARAARLDPIRALRHD